MDYEKLFKRDLTKMKASEKEKTIKQQVDFINEKLKLSPGLSVTKLIKKELKLNKSTIVSRFTTNGYRYDEVKREYLLTKNEDESANVLVENIPVVQKYDKSMIINEVAVTKQEEICLQEPSLDPSILLDLKDIIELKSIIQEMAQDYIRNKNIIDVDGSNKLEINLSGTDEIITRTIKIYKSINEDWKNFCDKNKQFKMQDLYSQALLEFMNKYK